MEKQPNLKKIETEAAYEKENYDSWHGRNETSQDELNIASRSLKRVAIDSLPHTISTYEKVHEKELQLGEAATAAAVSEHYLQYSEKKAAEHYQDNKEAYHELALIDAHKEGVVINVEQPLEIGQKIDVHMTQQPVHTTLQPLLRRY